MAHSSDDDPTAAVVTALVPYAWRDLTDRMLVRRVVAAVDRNQVMCFLSGLPGTDVGVVDALEPAEAGDERVDALVCALDGHLWREWSLTRLCAHLISTLDAWHVQRKLLESDLRRLLEGH